MATGGVVTGSNGSITGGAVGVDVNGAADVSLTNWTISGTTAEGAVMTGGALTLTGGSVTGAGADGVAASGGTLTIDGTTIEMATNDGVALSGSTIASVDGAFLDDNTLYGLSCDGGVGDPTSSTVTLDPCTATPSGNLVGDYSLINGCEVTWSCQLP